ncbi:MAG: response regulator [bacterium]
MGRRLLVVDDDENIAALIKIGLESEGYEVDVAYDGQSALEKVHSNPRYDLIVLDLMMPGLDGYEVCKELKTQREYNPIPILMLTAKRSEEDRIQGLRVGADGYMTKPFDLADLSRTVGELVLEREEMMKSRGIRERVSLSISSEIAYLRQVNQLVSKLYSSTDLDEDDIVALDLALNEIGSNAIIHGNRLDPNKIVEISYTMYEDRIELRIRDEGLGFEPDSVPDPTSDERLYSPSGRGIYMIRKLMDDVKYLGSGNEVVMTKYFPSWRRWAPSKGRTLRRGENSH